ncbi:MAG: hypothetical protein WC582_03995 [Patescibacteria group bacterium]
MTEEQEIIVAKLAALGEDTDSRDWPEVEEYLYKLNLPLTWAQICLAAYTRAKGEVLKTWLLLEYVNGWRRQIGKWDMQMAIKILTEIESRIDRLPDEHPRKDRLIGLWFYHSGWVYHPAGEFIKAAECHDLAAERAKQAGDKPGELLSLYNAAYEYLNGALKDNEVCSILKYYEDFKSAAQNFLDNLKSNSDHDVRWRSNVHCHQILFAWLAVEKYPKENDIAFLDELPESLLPSFVDAAVVIRTLSVFPENWGQAETIASGAVLVSETDWYAFAQLIRFSAFINMGKSEKAAIVLAELKNFLSERHGGHLALAIMND